MGLAGRNLAAGSLGFNELAAAKRKPATLTAPLLFEVLGLPQPAGSKRAFPFQKKGGGIGVAVTDANPKSREWKNLVADAAVDACQLDGLLEGPIVLHLAFELPRPTGHFGKRGLRASARPFPSVKPDLLKLARAVEDALTGVLWRDDAQIVEEVLTKRYGERAKLTVIVEEKEKGDV